MKKNSHKPQPERFQVYTQTSDGNGFRIPNSNYIYKFDQYGGWKDEYGNYYNADGSFQQEQPQGALSPQELSNESQSDHDQFQKLYGPSGYHSQSQEDERIGNIKFLEKISQNLLQLQNFPKNTPLRVYFNNLSYFLKPDQVYSIFSKKTPGIINIVFEHNDKGQRNGSGHFVMDSSDSAQIIINCQGEDINQRNIHFQLESIQDLMMDPLSQAELKPFKSKYFDKKQSTESPKKQYQNKQKSKNIQIETQKEEIKKEKPKYIKKEAINKQSANQKQKNNQKTTQVKNNVQLQKIQKQTASQQKNIEPTNEKKIVHQVQEKQHWKTYRFDLKIFPKRQNFEEWMKEKSIFKDKDYKDLRGMKRKDQTTYGQLKMRKECLSRCNQKLYGDKKVIFQQNE